MIPGNIIGKGNTATVYEWGEDRVLKLFNQGYPHDAVEKEYRNAYAINPLDFAKPRTYGIITYENRTGIIYDKVEGESLLDRVLRTGDLRECAVYMANLHKSVLRNKNSNVPSYKDFLMCSVGDASISPDKKKDLISLIDKLPGGDTLCHGDFHPGNIIISGDKAYLIDFMNICIGNYLYDIARTVFLVQYTPVPDDAKDKDLILQFKKALADEYLKQMNITREAIRDYLTVIIEARKGECPDE